MENVLTCCGERSESSAVEGVDEGDDYIPLGVLAVLIKAVFSCQLNCALVSLCARVAEKDLFIACGLAQLCGKVSLNFGVIII